MVPSGMRPATSSTCSPEPRQRHKLPTCFHFSAQYNASRIETLNYNTDCGKCQADRGCFYNFIQQLAQSAEKCAEMCLLLKQIFGPPSSLISRFAMPAGGGRRRRLGRRPVFRRCPAGKVHTFRPESDGRAVCLGFADVVGPVTGE